MRKEVILESPTGEQQTYPMLATAATAIRYKYTFHEDLIQQMQKLDMENINFDLINQLAYVMNCEAKEVKCQDMSYDDYFNWCSRIDSGSIIDHAGDIITTYVGNRATSSIAKKKKDHPNVN